VDGDLLLVKTVTTQEIAMSATSFEEMLKEETAKREKLVLEYEGQFRGDVFLATLFPPMALIPGMCLYWIWTTYWAWKEEPLFLINFVIAFMWAVIGLALIAVGVAGLIGACRVWFRLRKLRKAGFFDSCWDEYSR